MIELWHDDPETFFLSQLIWFIIPERKKLCLRAKFVVIIVIEFSAHDRLCLVVFCFLI